MSFDDPTWWRHAVIYQVYPRSFADSDGNGIGDLPGITARLDHLADLGVDAVWLSPFYPSPQADAGYDVADYENVDPLFGTLADIDALIAKAKTLGLRVIVDLVPNHTSDAHPWFQAALAAGPGSPERARYLFRDGRGPHGDEPPNDWLSEFGGSAWQRLPDGQWYLHLFDVRQPDLNWDNREVRDAFIDILRFWLDRGVDGFRVDVAHALVKADQLPDWPYAQSQLTGTAPDGARPPMYDQEGVHDIYREWHKVLEEYGPDKILVAEAWVEPAERLARYVRPDEMQQAFNFEYLQAPWRAEALRNVIDRSLAATASVGAPTTWVLSNHDVVRHTSRFGLPAGTPLGRGIRATDRQPDEALGLRRGRAASLLMLALPGSAYVYQGEELGLPEYGTMPDSARQDPGFFRGGHAAGGRDGCRVPIPWRADAPSYGFGPSARTWLPQPAGWARYALDQQRGVPGSTYELYRAALRLRREHRLGEGKLRWVEMGPSTVAFRTGDLLAVANLGHAAVPLPAGAEVLVSSAEVKDTVPRDTTVWARLR